MFSKDKIKFKYRVVATPDSDYPLAIQRKGRLFWWKVGSCRTLELAKENIRKMASMESAKPGEVLFEYSHEDYLMDRLKQ